MKTLPRLFPLLRLGQKELLQVARDPLLLVLVIYTFTFAIYSAATALPETLHRATVSIVDEDHSPLSRQIADALQEPYFSEPDLVSHRQMDARLDAGRDIFALNIPPDFQADVLAGKQPALQLNVDATRMSQAFAGSGYLERIVRGEIVGFVDGYRADERPAADLALRARFNPQLDPGWFGGIIETISNVTLLALVLGGASLIREKEHGTLQHLLSLPIRPSEILLSKVLSMGLIVLVAALFALEVIVEGVLAVPVRGSLLLFGAGTVLHLLATTSLGILLGLLAPSMPRFGLLTILVLLPLQMLSGGMTPRESMPEWIQTVMLAAPNTHYVALAEAVLFRGAGWGLVWPQLLALLAIGSALFAIALARFRASLGEAG
jgi:ABC-2 type transport system permease protein